MNAYLQTKPFPQSDEKMEKWIQSLEKAQHESDPNGIDAPGRMQGMMGWPKKSYQQDFGWVGSRIFCRAVISENATCLLTLI